MKLPVTLWTLLAATAATVGQDMPLDEILRPGESWRVHDGPMPSGKVSQSDLVDRAVDVGEAYSPKGSPHRHLFVEPVCGVMTPDRTTFYIADAADEYIWTTRVERDGSLNRHGDRYCRLRVRGDRRLRGQRPEDFRADPSAMTIDGANRLYVATNLGIQVFDSIGRLCGVITAPPGRIVQMTFDGDRLFARVGDRVHVRRMLAVGP